MIETVWLARKGARVEVFSTEERAKKYSEDISEHNIDFTAENQMSLDLAMKIKDADAVLGMPLLRDATLYYDDKTKKWCCKWIVWNGHPVECRECADSPHWAVSQALGKEFVWGEHL